MYFEVLQYEESLLAVPRTLAFSRRDICLGSRCYLGPALFLN
jgi:hypothetical protein